MATARRRRRPAFTADKGTSHAQAMQARFGSYCADALGRAYASGLLGSDANARAMLDTGRKMARIYRARYDHGCPRCALAPRTGGNPEDVERVLAEDKWLTARLNAVRSCGTAVAVAFAQLVIEPHADAGPPWLDRLIACAEGGNLNREDLAPLAAALEGLEAAL